MPPAGASRPAQGPLCVALSALLSTAADRAAAALYVADIDDLAKLPAAGSPFKLTEPILPPVVQVAAFSAPSLSALGHPRIDGLIAERLTAFALDIGASIAAWAATAPAPIPTATVSGLLLILTMLTAILVVADRRTDARSRRAWSRLDLSAAQLSATSCCAREADAIGCRRPSPFRVRCKVRGSTQALIG
jgi:hypothetical protein